MPVDHQRTLRATALAMVAAVGLTACSPSGASVDHDDRTVAANSAGAGVTPLGDADTTRKTLRPEAPAQLVVSNVRVGSHAGFDRVIFDLSGAGDPGWFMDYTDNPVQQGSGKPISHHGDVALNVNIDGTTYPFELGMDDPQIGTVQGAGSVAEVISAGTFEGRSQFIISLDSQLPYSVEVLEDPSRVVIDILQT